MALLSLKSYQYPTLRNLIYIVFSADCQVWLFLDPLKTHTETLVYLGDENQGRQLCITHGHMDVL